MSKLLMRMCPPSKYDPAPHKTICRVDGEEGKSFYIQVGMDDQTPEWIAMGDFLVNVFEDKFHLDYMVELWIEEYENQ